MSGLLLETVMSAVGSIIQLPYSHDFFDHFWYMVISLFIVQFYPYFLAYIKL